MMRILSLILVLLVGFGATVLAGEHDDHATGAKVADPRFEFLSDLSGTWVASSGGPDVPEGMLFEFRVTAGGTAVEEREMIGTPNEMVTLYTMQGDDLVATHYCMLGNQPRARAAEWVDGKTLGFACDGRPGNARSHDDPHIHGWTLRLGDDGRIHYAAQMSSDGQVTEVHEVVLTRQTETASR